MELKCKMIRLFLLVFQTNVVIIQGYSASVASGVIKSGESGGLVGKSTKRQESKIAEIFIGVAYGAAKQELEVKGILNQNTRDKLSMEKNVDVFSSENTFDNIANEKVKESILKSKEMSETSVVIGDHGITNERKQSLNETSKLVLKSSMGSPNSGTFNVSIKIYTQLGVFWYVHVYLFAFLFSAVSLLSLSCLISLLCLSGDCFYWRGLLLYCLILIVTLTRSALLVTDPYGVYHYFQESVSAILHGVIIPGTTTLVALSLSVIVGKTCVRLQLLPNWVLFGVSLVLTVTTVALDVMGPLQKLPQTVAILKTVTLASVAFWGSVLGLGFVALLIKVEKIFLVKNEGQRREKLSPPPVECQSQSLYFRMASRFGAAAGFIQLFLSGLIVYSLVGPRGPPGTSPLLTWAWCLQHSLSRLLEVGLCFCLTISTTFISITNQKIIRSPFLNPFQLIFRACCKPGTAGIHPAKSNSRQPLNVFTIQNASNSVDYMTSDFQLVWNKEKQVQQDQNYHQSSFYFASDVNKLSTFENKSSKLGECSKFDSKARYQTLPYKQITFSNIHSTKRGFDGAKRVQYDSHRGMTLNSRIKSPNYKNVFNPTTSSESFTNNISGKRERNSSKFPVSVNKYRIPVNTPERVPVHFIPFGKPSNIPTAVEKNCSIVKVGSVAYGDDRRYPYNTLPLRTFKNN